MKPKYIYKNKRQKAFLGAAIGAVANVVGGIISAKKQKKAEEEAFKQQQEAQFRNDNVSQISVLSQMANNTGYIDDYKKRISFKCGGRKKGLLGIDFKQEAGDALGGLTNLTSSVLTNTPSLKKLKQGVTFSDQQQKTNLINDIYSVDDNNDIINDRMQMYKIGGRKRSKCK